jgi:hypothetical protein
MLSPTNPRRLDEPITVSLEALVPADHVYSHLAEVIGSRFPSIVRAEKTLALFSGATHIALLSMGTPAPSMGQPHQQLATCHEHLGRGVAARVTI